MRHMLKPMILAGTAALMLTPALAQSPGAEAIDFGDDSGIWANDDQCDDPRFEGDSMSAILDDEDAFHDATDCQTAFEAGEITLASHAASKPLTNKMPGPDSPSEEVVDFGDDAGDYALDGECDDARFIGEGMTTTGLLEADIAHDASDCAVAFEAGDIRLRGKDDPSMEDVMTPSDPETPINEAPADGIVFNGINFGDNESEWALDDECDDPRFDGDGMTGTNLLDEDAYHDADDCLAAWKAGTLTYKGH